MVPGDLSAVMYRYIRDNGPVSRSDITEHVKDMRPDGSSDNVWYQKISNTLIAFKKSGEVDVTGSRRCAQYTAVVR